jgi:hypothetical protein
MRRQVRVLMAWFERMDAISALLGFRMPAEGEDVSLAAATYQAHRAALLARPPFEPEPMAIEPLPAAIADRGEAVLRRLRPSVEAAGTSSRLAAGLVDLRYVLSFQKAVSLEEIGKRVAAVSADDWKSLADVCLPVDGVEEELSGTYDRDGHGLTLTSLNPNLRVGPVRTVVMPDGSGARLIGFALMFGTPHVHVVEYRGRYFLKDGYHRGYGLLSRGITRVPAIVERARTFGDVHGGATTLVSQEYLLGTHPPRLMDFHDPAVSATVCQQALRKAIRIRAEDFVMNV